MGLLQRVQPAIILGTETWLDASIGSAERFLDNYAVYKVNRNLHSGGVFIHVEKSIPSTPSTPVKIPEVKIEIV